jgi:uncharacterized SAM-binding protein YcdF (DUF218 family)
MSRRRIALAIVLVLLAALLAATARWILWPPADAPPAHADAVVVLGGGGSERLSKGVELMEEGIAPVLVISDAENSGTERARELCADGDPDFEVVCVSPDPARTQGEARVTARLAEERGWKSIVVVTSDYHATRAGWLFGRCFGYDVPVVSAGPHGAPGPWQVVHEWLAFAHAAVIARGC